MNDKAEDLKKNLFDALKTFGIDLDDKVKGKKGSLDEEYSDYSEMNSKTRRKIDELNENGEKLLEKTGMTREALEAYGSNPNNFTKEQWEALQKIKQMTEEYKKLSIEGLSQTMSKDIEDLSKKEKKKQQARFAKKKDWKAV